MTMTRQASAAPDILSESARLLLELLVDLIEGDVISHDLACRDVADAFITSHESFMRHLVADGVLPWHSFAQAMNTYCIRRVLLRSPEPEVLMQSAAVVRGLQQLARFLQHSEQPRCAGELAPLGVSLATQVATLHTKYDPTAYTSLIDCLSEVVLIYLADTGTELSLSREADVCHTHSTAAEKIDLRYGPGMPLTTLAHSVQRLAQAAHTYRAAVKRARDGALDAAADNLLFHSSSVTQDDENEEEENKVSSVRPATQRPRRELRPPRDSFGEACHTLDIAQAGESVPDTSSLLPIEPSAIADSPVPHGKHSASTQHHPPRRQRPVLLNNASGLTELDESHTSETSRKSVPPCAGQSTPVPPPSKEWTGNTTGMDDVTAFVETQAHRTSEVRRYFLSPQTNRYEPLDA